MDRPALGSPLPRRDFSEFGPNQPFGVGQDGVQGLSVGAGRILGGQGRYLVVARLQGSHHQLQVFFDQMRQAAVQRQHGQRVPLQHPATVQAYRRDPHPLSPDFQRPGEIAAQGVAADIGQRDLKRGVAEPATGGEYGLDQGRVLHVAAAGKGIVGQDNVALGQRVSKIGQHRAGDRTEDAEAGRVVDGDQLAVGRAERAAEVASINQGQGRQRTEQPGTDALEDRRQPLCKSLIAHLIPPQ